MSNSVISRCLPLSASSILTVLDAMIFSWLSVLIYFRKLIFTCGSIEYVSLTMVRLYLSMIVQFQREQVVLDRSIGQRSLL